EQRLARWPELPDPSVTSTLYSGATRGQTPCRTLNETRGRPMGGPSAVVPYVAADYRRRVRTLCDDWFACASTEVPACWRICSLVKLTISEAMSTSRMRLSAL